MVCGLLLIFIIHYLRHSRGAVRAFWATLLGLGGLNLVLSESFGGILFFAAAVLFYLFVSRAFTLRHLAPLLMVISLVFFLVVALRFAEARELAPAKLRFANWAQAGRVAAQAPVLGVGLGNYEAAVPPHVRPGEPVSIYAHNFFLQFLAETGWPLFLVALAAVVLFLKGRMARFLDPANAPFAAACVLVLLFNLFDVGSYFLAAGIGFAVAFSQVVRLPGAARPRHFIAVALPALLLLVHAAAASRRHEGDLRLSSLELTEAEACYQAALKLDPFSYRSWLGIAHAAWRRGDAKQAGEAAAEALKLFPGQPYANYLLSRVAWRAGSYSTAHFHARLATMGSAGNKEYQRWHETVQRDLAAKSALPGS